ncbi:nucleotide-binding protein [Lentibacillus salinarum]|uniref:P-loop NTPase n=1 Tax=Lentibacillus salinarum TaxID=446820 RepID=A0ABW3ZXF4_9BACI
MTTATKTKKVMVIETNEQDAQQGARALSQVEGAEIALLTPSTSLALDKIGQEPPFLVVIDEKVQGWQDFCRQVSQVSPQTKMVVTTDQQNSELGQIAKGVGAVAILIKPLHQMQDELPNLFQESAQPEQEKEPFWNQGFSQQDFSMSSVFQAQTQQTQQDNPFEGAQPNGGAAPFAGQPMQEQRQAQPQQHNPMMNGPMGNGQQPMDNMDHMPQQPMGRPMEMQQQPMGMQQGGGGMQMFGQAPPRPKMIVTVYSPKGGVGKTTMSLNLAVALRQLSMKYLGAQNAFNVGLVDFDVDFGDVAASLQLVPRGSVVDWPKDENFNPDYVKNLFTFHQSSGVMILAGPERPEMEFLLNEEQAKHVISGTHQMFDIVVVDMGYSIRKSSLMAMSMATHPFFITTPDTPAVRDMTRAKKSLNEHNINLSQSQLIVNKMPKKGRPPLSPQEVKRYIGMEIAGEVQDDPAVLDALSEGTPLTLKGKSPAATEIERIAQNIIQDYLPQDVGKKTSFFQRLFGGK